jgi:hypothetical protein
LLHVKVNSKSLAFSGGKEENITASELTSINPIKPANT